MRSSKSIKQVRLASISKKTIAALQRTDCRIDQPAKLASIKITAAGIVKNGLKAIYSSQ